MNIKLLVETFLAPQTHENEIDPRRTLCIKIIIPNLAAVFLSMQNNSGEILALLLASGNRAEGIWRNQTAGYNGEVKVSYGLSEK